MRRPLARATVASIATMLVVSLMSTLPARAEPDASEGSDPQEQQEFDALALAEQSGERVEIPGLTDEKTQHFANPDGSLTAEVSAVPVRVRSSQGWMDVDTDLVRGADGLIRPKAAGMDIAFSGGGDSVMAHVGIGSNSVSLGWIEGLPEPTLEGEQATYSDVLPDVDLVLTAGVEGFSQVLVVHTPEAAQLPELAELELPLSTVGVTMTVDEYGNLDAVGEAGGQSVFSAQAPAMWDSSTEPEPVAEEDPTLGPLMTSRVEAVETTLGIDHIRLVPDQGMLVDEATEFPIYIDPSVSASRPNRAYVDRTYPNQAYFNTSSSKPVGVGRYSGPEGTYTRRAFFQFTVMARTMHPNTIINSATLRAEVDWAYGCNSNSYIQLQRVSTFNRNTTWNKQPSTQGGVLDTQNVRGGWATCPSSSGVEFDATSAYKWGVDNKASHIYLRLKERDESGTAAWRRIELKKKPPVLVVNYNHPPAKPVTSTISDSLGGVCSTDQDKPRLINDTTVTFNAQLRDRDSYWVGQQVKSRFEWKSVADDTALGTADSAYVTVGKWSGGSYRPVTARDLPEKEPIAYRVRGHDKSNWGPWSSWCYLEIDTTKPDSGPEVTSTDYPAGDEVHGSAGRSGEFTFANNGVDQATSYHYSLNDASCSTEIELDEPGASVTLPITPRRDGPNLIHARISDAYGNSSECGLVYRFTVAPPAEPISHFALDEGQGDSATDAMDTERIATASGNLDWTRGRVGHRDGDTYRLENTGLDTASGERLSTQGPVVVTDEAFSVAAWVRLDEDPSRAYTAVAQDGERHSGFYLGYQHTQGGRWIFKQAPYDGDDTSISERVLSTEQAQTGVWTHLVGTYDPESRELALYVDGVKQGTHVQQSAWNAEGPFVIGGALYRGTHHDFWPGGIDDVRVWDRVLFDEPFIEDDEARSEVWELANRPAALEGRWKLDETEGTLAADSSDHGLDATLHADPLTAWNQALNEVTFAPGVSLNVAEQEHLAAAGPAVRTDRSYSVAAWVRLDEVGHNSTAVAQNGDDHSAFYLSYQHTYEHDKWVMKLPPEDRTGTSGWHRSLSDRTAEFGRWTHLAATYDHTLGQATLYVDGVAQDPVEIPEAWHANGPLLIGGARFEQQFFDPWSGDINDVHLYQGVLSQADINNVYEGLIPTGSS